MKIALASDYAGFTYKELIKEYLLKKGFEIKDQGTFSEKSVDYPDYIKVAAHDVASNKSHWGIGVCGSGIGVSITANNFKGIRAALVLNIEMASLFRKHNNSNFLALGERLIDRKLQKLLMSGSRLNLKAADIKRELIKSNNPKSFTSFHNPFSLDLHKLFETSEKFQGHSRVNGNLLNMKKIPTFALALPKHFSAQAGE